MVHNRKFQLKVLNFLVLVYRRVSKLTCQPKNVGKMEDFEALTLCISLNQSEMCAYFCKDLVTGHCLYLVNNSIPNRHPFSDRFCYSCPVAMA